MLVRSPLVTLCLALTLSACGGSAPKGPPPAEQQAKADKEKQAVADEAAIAERKTKREAEDKAKAAAAATTTAELERLTVVPEKLPKNTSCDEVGKSQDAFMRRVGDPKAIAAWDAGGKDRAIPMTVVQCTQADSIKVAACQKNALDGAGPELKDETKKMMQMCIDKFAERKAAPAGMPQKRPG